MNQPTIFYRGHAVVDADRRKIGRISDIVYDAAGDPEWAVVDLGILRSSHYVPVDAGYMSTNGDFVVPYAKDTIRRAPRAERDHIVDPLTEEQLQQHYELR
ncbi:MAG: PRC-barrel domain-containing protein [Actinomycetota bacterium]